MNWIKVDLKSRKVVWLFLVLLLSINDGVTAASTNAYYYDSSNRLVFIEVPSGTIEYQYDKNGNTTGKYSTDNLIRNGGFERGNTDNWGKAASTGITTEYAVVSSTVSSGKFAQKLSASNMLQNSYINLFQDIKVTENTNYAIGGMIKIQALTNAKAMIAIHYFNNTNMFLGSKDLVNLSDPINVNWASIGANIMTPSTAVRARIHIQITGIASGASGTVFFDSMTFRPSLTSNLLTNPNFEKNLDIVKDVADDWQTYTSAGLQPEYELTYSTLPSKLQVQQIKLAASSTSGYLGCYQDVIISGNTASSLKRMPDVCLIEELSILQSKNITRAG